VDQAEKKSEPTPRDAVRDLLRKGLKAALATLDRTSGHPYASLVTIATEPDATPLILISRLALHTQNIVADGRASLMIDGTNSVGDPLAGGRVTVIGRAETTQSTTARQRFLARHPHAATYVDFPDFAFYRLVIDRAHFIGGFGRIVDLAPADILVDLGDAEALVAAEEGIIEHMNADHADAVRLYATALLGARDGDWRMIGIDPLGLDMLLEGEALRLGFESRITSPDAARKELVRLVGVARSAG
jgi:putative heme iron utilization protein